MVTQSKDYSSILKLKSTLSNWRSSYWCHDKSGKTLKYNEGIIYTVEELDGEFRVTFILNHSTLGRLASSFIVRDSSSGLWERHVKPQCWRAYYSILGQIGDKSPEHQEVLEWCFPESEQFRSPGQDLAMYLDLKAAPVLAKFKDYKIGPLGRGRKTK